jgi:predicted ATPase
LLQFESVRLFTDRAQHHQPGFTVTEKNAPAVASICKRLDGIPLAIELAAARVRSLSVHDIDAHLDERFRLLSAGSTTAPRDSELCVPSLTGATIFLVTPKGRSFDPLRYSRGGGRLER